MSAPEIGNVIESARLPLLTFLETRPNVTLPPHVAKLDGVQGFYVGDGRPTREIVLGFEPRFVVFLIPGWPDGPPGLQKDMSYFRPELHAQPAYTKKGFVVDQKFNELGKMNVYVVWKESPPK